MSTTNNETRFEQVGDKEVKFENINGTWKVSSHEIHRVFKGHTTTNHASMISKMRTTHQEQWDTYTATSDIDSRPYKTKEGNTYAEFLFTRTAFTYFCLSFTGKVANEYKFHFVNKFFELEALVIKVAQGQTNLCAEAQELLNNATDLTGVYGMGEFAQLINQRRTGANISRTNLYQLLRDMKYVYQDANNNTQLGAMHLDTVEDDKGYVSVKVYKYQNTILMDKIAKWLSLHPENCANEYFGNDIADVSDTIQLEVNDKDVTVKESSKKAWMKASGVLPEYNMVKTYEKQFHGHVLDKAAKLGLDEYTITYEDKPLPDKAKPIMEGNKCVGYTVSIAGGTITWED